MDSKPKHLKPVPIHYVAKTDSPEFTHLVHSLKHSSIIGLDAEWKPTRTHQSSFPTVSLLQIACQLNRVNSTESVEKENVVVFLVDLLTVEVKLVYEVLREMFVSDNVLKLGFRFKQDLAYLSSTFCSHGCDPGFDRVEPFIDIASVYHNLQIKQSRRKLSKETKSLAAICQELLGLSLSKELQCSDWSFRPLTEEQKVYAAADAQCLLEIFDIFQDKVLKQDKLLRNNNKLPHRYVALGLKEIFVNTDVCDNILRRKYLQASDLVRSYTISEIRYRAHTPLRPISRYLSVNTALECSLSKLVQKYGETLLLKESDRKPSTSKKKGKRQTSVGLVSNGKKVESYADYQGPPPWDSSLGGDGCPKFLCDVMVEGLAKHLRCVGIDAAIPYSKKPETRQLIDQAYKEKRVLLTRDAKLLRHEYLIANQIYLVKSLLKDDQLLEGTQYQNALQKFIDVCNLKN
ncbi:hypothetical protein IFM89_017032 [Coptis chinensis]|uniref:3'-5' exonuclease domain-containing protein n=1 Tax=Coptis chinensis TaxID=261450 RepID=A0A835HMM8_9MAGN|nr:hypothetical protein IFM89_017032 [Coptis chinensis]